MSKKSTDEKTGKSLGKGLGKGLGKSPIKGLGTRPLGANPLAGSPLGGGSLGGGQGLGALIPGGSMIGRLLEVSLDQIRPDNRQPRKRFQQDSLEELADSIKANGILQPIIVSPAGGGFYQIIAGERRWRAARMAGLTTVPVVSRDVGEQEAFELALLENIQRVDLTPLEEATSYQRLAEEFGLSHEQIAERTGKKRATISNALRLLKLPIEVLTLIDDQILSAGHGRALLTLKDERLMLKFAEQSVAQSWSVRTLEQKVRQVQDEPESTTDKLKDAAWINDLQTTLLNALSEQGLKAKIKGKKDGSAQLSIDIQDEAIATKLLHLLKS